MYIDEVGMDFLCFFFLFSLLLTEESLYGSHSDDSSCAESSVPSPEALDNLSLNASGGLVAQSHMIGSTS